MLPPGAACSPATDIKSGNGGVHFYRFDGLTKRTPRARPRRPSRPTRARPAAARRSSGRRSEPSRRASLCTAHVFQQIPGQNRIFMGWYSQGTRVLDFTERPDGRVELKEAGWLIPENANTWVSHVFDWQRNPERHLHLLGRHRRLQPRARRPQRDRHLQGHPAAAPAALHRLPLNRGQLTDDDLLRETAGITHRRAVLSAAGARAAPSGRGGGSRPGPRRRSARRRGRPR